ncbi:hypothetical protein FDP41_012977 [Naegleria fowleri]|uniref:RGS domain-containing protein n=1 Tax=Naegleria fowleri TaxID=5763 RepID=A0A6A5C7C4_NAEFO|nr:uncharacterized protein FDP41_012977 [Naegleria fowleri]KAF0981189.1 hypothetical protein FDP41_012977 [Naegleria fowleri]CAG4713369.1 unnamed protein product [Naegleria fowleri]
MTTNLWFLLDFDMTLDNNSSSSYSPITKTNVTECHPDLFLLNSTSRELFPIIEYDICPDTYVSFSIMLVFVILYGVMIAVAGVGLIWKRHSGHIMARNLGHLFTIMISGFLFVFMFCIRIVIGRKIFPCAVYSLCFFVSGPVVTMPTTCRCLKLFFEYRLNLFKMKLFGDESSFKVQQSFVATSMNLSTKETQEGGEKELGAISNKNHQVSDVTKIDSSQSTSSSSISNLFKSTSAGQCSDLVDEDLLPMKKLATPRELRILKFFQFMVSYKFVAVAFIAIFLLQIAIWLIVGSADEIVYAVKGERSLVASGFFEFRHGCIVTYSVLIIILVEAIVHISLEVVALILCFISDRDTWNIKKETLVAVICQIFAITGFVVAGYIPIVATLTDYFVPYLLSLVGYIALDVIICVLLPIFYAIRAEYLLERKDMTLSDSSVEIVLKHKKAYPIMLDFARRSYCPEAVLCWSDIQRFKKTVNKEKRKEMAQFIIDTYVTISSPLEINIPNIAKTHQELNEKLKANQVVVDMFQQIEIFCIQDLNEVLHRLSASNKFIASLIETR